MNKNIKTKGFNQPTKIDLNDLKEKTHCGVLMPTIASKPNNENF